MLKCVGMGMLPRGWDKLPPIDGIPVIRACKSIILSYKDSCFVHFDNGSSRPYRVGATLYIWRGHRYNCING